MVAPRRGWRALNRHVEDHARELEAVGSGRRDAQYGREDDVRSAAEGDGQADERGAEEDGYVEEVSGAASGDGLFTGQDELK